MLNSAFSNLLGLKEYHLAEFINIFLQVWNLIFIPGFKAFVIVLVKGNEAKIQLMFSGESGNQIERTPTRVGKTFIFQLKIGSQRCKTSLKGCRPTGETSMTTKWTAI